MDGVVVLDDGQSGGDFGMWVMCVRSVAFFGNRREEECGSIGYLRAMLDGYER